MTKEFPRTLRPQATEDHVPQMPRELCFFRDLRLLGPDSRDTVHQCACHSTAGSYAPLQGGLGEREARTGEIVVEKERQT